VGSGQTRKDLNMNIKTGRTKLFASQLTFVAFICLLFMRRRVSHTPAAFPPPNPPPGERHKPFFHPLCQQFSY